MNYRLLVKHLGIVCLLIGVTMLFSLPWALPQLGHRHGDTATVSFETEGFWGLVRSILTCFALAGALLWLGRGGKGRIFRKEAMAMVGISWVTSAFLGALPYLFSPTYRCASVRLHGPEQRPQLFAFGGWSWNRWVAKELLAAEVYPVIQALLDARARGQSADQLAAVNPNADALLRQLAQDPDWEAILLWPGDPGPPDRAQNYRIRWVRMGLIDALFESQSGFSTTGATVLADVEDPHLVQHCILFWRSSTHFLGGLGIVVLFVALLGQGSAGKAMMRAEMPGPSKEGVHSRMQHTAWVFAAIYCALNALLSIILKIQGMTWFDALCHAFGTMATGGFSTYNRSIAHFDRADIDLVIILFMVLAGTNFALLYQLMRHGPARLWSDVEWRAYMGILALATGLVVLFGLSYGDFRNVASDSAASQLGAALRYGGFQVVSVLTTTGFTTHDFNAWNSFARGLLFLLMFIGGCAGSTGGGLKVVRHVLFLKILWLEIEQAYHPTVVRSLRLGRQHLDDPRLRENVLVYFGLILIIFVTSWIAVITFEPDATWGHDPEHKLLDSASAVAATLNNIGPGLGVVGATENYSHFSGFTKFLFTWLMMLGRVEVFAIVVLFIPAFWRR